MQAVPGTHRFSIDGADLTCEAPRAFVEKALPIADRWLRHKSVAFAEPPPRHTDLDRLLHQRVRRAWRYVVRLLHESGPASDPRVTAVLEDLDALHARLACDVKTPRVYHFETADALASLYPASLGRLSTRLGGEVIDLGACWRSGRPSLPSALEDAVQDRLRELKLAGLHFVLSRNEQSPGAEAFGTSRFHRHRKMPDLIATIETYIDAEGEDDAAARVLRRLDVIDHIDLTRERVLEVFPTHGREGEPGVIEPDFIAPAQVAFHRRMALALWGSDWSIAPEGEAALQLGEDIGEILCSAAACCASNPAFERFLDRDDAVAEAHRSPETDGDDPPRVAEALSQAQSAAGDATMSRKMSFRLQRVSLPELCAALRARSWAIRAERAARTEADVDVRRFATTWRADAQIVIDGLFTFSQEHPARRRRGWNAFPRFAGGAMTDRELCAAIREFRDVYHRAWREYLIERINDAVKRAREAGVRE